MYVIGFDTSNYTTSIAAFDGINGYNCSQLLPVKQGELGLRQSDAVFAHIKSLPDLSGRLFSNMSKQSITAVGVSTRPRAVEGSYMPCFMVGYSHAKLLSEALCVPLVEVSHQQGHVAASLWSADRLDLMDKPHLAWHLSGGTTELLLVEPEGRNVRCTRIGGTTDISAGQLIDRTGQMLSLPFPSGKHIDVLSREAKGKDLFKVKCNGAEFSLSGVQNKVQQYYASSGDASETAAFSLRCVANAVRNATENALKQYPGLAVVFSGGVASNSMLRQVMEPLGAVFSQPQYSTDNAMGVAVLAYRHQEVTNGAESIIHNADK
jgi:N6-L-threonylcarbamoyladenine synthase